MNLDKIETHSSRLAITALGLSPDAPGMVPPDISPDDTRCCFCGQEIRAGEPCKFRPLRNNQSNLDANDMACRSSLISCRWCFMVTKRPVTVKTSATVFTLQGAYPIAKDVNRAWLFNTPPEPPFLVTVANAKSQHLVWRTPVTLDSEMMTVRYGLSLFTIRHSVLQKLVALCDEAAAILNKDTAQSGSRRVRKVTYSHPFMALDRECKNLHHGRILFRAIEIARENSRMAEIIGELRGATKGELWALSTLVKKNRPVAEKPATIKF